MKVGLNATCFNDRPSGARQRFIGIYGELVKRLPDVDFLVYEPADCRVSEWFDGAPNVATRQTPIPSEGRVRKVLRGLRYWDKSISKEGLDLFEMFNLPIVRIPNGKTVLTIHDIRGMRAGKPLFARAAYRAFVGMSLRSADHVVTVSEAVKDEILEFYPGVETWVVYNGLDPRAFDSVAEPDLAALRQEYGLPDEFILSVGHIERRKNYPRLIEAVARLRDRGRDCPLVIIGNDSGERNALEDQVASAGLSGYVKILSGLSDLEVRCAYKLCSLFVFPSSYEGFGIPILEAMAAGRPMVLSDIPVFREITQNRGIYFSWDDVESMAHAIEDVLSSSNECQRLVEYGNARVQAFSFQGLAAQIESLYRSLI